jgi:hypothetical protein
MVIGMVLSVVLLEVFIVVLRATEVTSEIAGTSLMCQEQGIVEALWVSIL